MSIEVVKNLQLKIESYLKPYELTWLNKDTEVIVDKHYLVLFSIDKRYLIVFGMI
jgi:uncharacterized protein (AIM24 family)